MGAWGHQPLENDAAWDIIGSITDTVIQAIGAALEVGEALRARHALWLLGVLDARLPAVVMPERASICCTPNGVQGRKRGWPAASSPRFSGWKVSTSFVGRMARITAASSMCFGNGNCTRIP